VNRFVVNKAAEALLAQLKLKYETTLELRRVLTAAVRKLGKMRDIHQPLLKPLPRDVDGDPVREDD
jgi:hypothetical protein